MTTDMQPAWGDNSLEHLRSTKESVNYATDIVNELMVSVPSNHREPLRHLKDALESKNMEIVAAIESKREASPYMMMCAIDPSDEDVDKIEMVGAIKTIERLRQMLVDVEVTIPTAIDIYYSDLIARYRKLELEELRDVRTRHESNPYVPGDVIKNLGTVDTNNAGMPWPCHAKGSINGSIFIWNENFSRDALTCKRLFEDDVQERIGNKKFCYNRRGIDHGNRSEAERDAITMSMHDHQGFLAGKRPTRWQIFTWKAKAFLGWGY